MDNSKASSKIEALPSPTPFYRLDDQLRVMPVQEKDFFESPDIFEDYNWTYQTRLPDGTLISSVFLGIAVTSIFNHQPLLFETMVFLPDGEPSFQKKHETMEECLKIHYRILDEEKDLDIVTPESHSRIPSEWEDPKNP